MVFAERVASRRAKLYRNRHSPMPVLPTSVAVARLGTEDVKFHLLTSKFIWADTICKCAYCLAIRGGTEKRIGPGKWGGQQRRRCGRRRLLVHHYHLALWLWIWSQAKKWMVDGCKRLYFMSRSCHEFHERRAEGPASEASVWFHLSRIGHLVRVHPSPSSLPRISLHLRVVRGVARVSLRP